MRYSGRKKSAISFPLGGIGAGCIGLAGNGKLIDWEIYNGPNKNSLSGYTHFSIAANGSCRLLMQACQNRILKTCYCPIFCESCSNCGGASRAISSLAPVPVWSCTKVHFRTVLGVKKRPCSTLHPPIADRTVS